MPLLSKNDFNRFVNTPNTWSVIGSLRIPRNSAFGFLRDDPVRLFLATEVRQDVQADADPTVVVATGFPFLDPIWLPAAEKVLGFYYSADGSQLLTSGITDYDAAAGTVTVQKAPNQAGIAVVQVLMPSGTVRIRKALPMGTGSDRAQNMLTMPVNLLSLVDRNRSPLYWQAAHSLLEDWMLQLELNAPLLVNWASELTVVSIRYTAMTMEAMLGDAQARFGAVDKVALEEAILANNW